MKISKMCEPCKWYSGGYRQIVGKARTHNKPKQNSCCDYWHRKRAFKKLDFFQSPKCGFDFVELEYFDKVKYQGLIFDRHLSWNGQISQMTQKVYNTIKKFEKFRDDTPEGITNQTCKKPYSAPTLTIVMWFSAT